MIGCLLAPLKVIWAFLRWTFTSGLKGWIVLGLLVVLVLFGVCKVNSAIQHTKTPVETTVSVPSKTDAPFIVQTSSRYYYAAEVVNNSGVVTMTRYYELFGGKWVFNPGTLKLGKEFGVVTVGRR